MYQVKGKQCEQGAGRFSTSLCNGNAKNTKSLAMDSKLINLDHGDPKMLEAYWKNKDEECAITIRASQLVSYFSDTGNLCWFLQPELGEAVKRLHRMVGNAVVDGRHIVVGTGSSQLYQAALYALSTTICHDSALPVNVTSPVPLYSSYPDLTGYLRSGLYKWGGDANTYKGNEQEPYIEVVCSPNNPRGSIRKPVVEACQGKKLLIHDLAYYWPHFTPITYAADHDLILFTVSKCTGHAGFRIGWAIVKDEAVARKMVKFIELNTIGTSKEAQMRAAKLMQSICNDYLDFSPPESEGFFEYGYRVMAQRWEKRRQTVNLNNKSFSLPDYPKNFCHFMGKYTLSNPAFAWMERKEVEDGSSLLREHKILTRSGHRFGADNKNVRISMMGSDDTFNVFLQCLDGISRSQSED